MIYAYNGKKQPLGQIELTVSTKREKTERQTLWGYTKTHHIKGKLSSQKANPQSDIIVQAAALEATFGKDGGDSILYLIDGTTKSHHVLLSSDCIGGTRVVEPLSFPNGKGVQNVNQLDWTVSIQGTVPIPDGELETTLQSFTETVEFSGGGFHDLHIPTLIGRPVKQRGIRHTPYRAVQQGTSVGLYRVPLVPPPLWPFRLVDQNPRKLFGHPEVIGDEFRNYEVTWTYQYQHAFQLVGQQHIWGATWQE